MTRLTHEDAGKLRIRICGGVNCSCGGGGRLLETAFVQALEEAGVSDKVEVFRAHCLGECADAPCVRIGADRFYQVGRDDVPMLVRDEVLTRI